LKARHGIKRLLRSVAERALKTLTMHVRVNANNKKEGKEARRP